MRANHASTPAVSTLADHWDVAERMAEQSHGWLLHPADRSLADALAHATDRWPSDQTAPDAPVTPLLYPLVYTDRPRVTAQQFCEITDAACEAERAGAQVHIVGIPLGRSRPVDVAADRLRRIADAWRHAGLPVDAANPLTEHPEAAACLVRRARGCAFTRRREDLIDLLVSAAADAIGAARVYLGAHVRVRRNLETLTCLAPLCRLYQPTPFADPPLFGKLRPAGSDSVWFLAFTLGLVDQPAIQRDREAVLNQVRARVGRCWNTLRAADITAHRVVDDQQNRIQLRLALPAGRDELPQPDAPIVLPVFGSPTISPATRALVASIAAVTRRDRLLVVDDVSPRFLYARYDPQAARAGFTELARSHGFGLRFLSDTPPARLAATLQELLTRLRLQDLTFVAPRGITSRSRGGLTAYDAVHLAVIAAAVRDAPGCLLVVKGANLPAAQRLAAHLSVAGLVVCTGADGWSGAVVDRKHIRVQADPAGLLPVLVGTR